MPYANCTAGEATCNQQMVFFVGVNCSGSSEDPRLPEMGSLLMSSADNECPPSDKCLTPAARKQSGMCKCFCGICSAVVFLSCACKHLLSRQNINST